MDIEDLKVELEQFGIIKENKLNNYFKKRLTKELIEEIIELTNFLEGDNIDIRERLYVIIKNIKEQQKCVVCNKPLRMILSGPKRFSYSQTCGPLCFNKLSSVKKKRENTCLKRYKSKHYITSENFQNKRRQTCLEKYNVENPGLIPHRVEKWRKTIENKYGSLEDFINLLKSRRKSKNENTSGNN